MVRRTKSTKRSRPKRSKGSRGASLPSRSRTQTDPWAGVGKRVNTSYEVLGHPQSTYKPADEGVHYKVLAYTDWADQFIPTMIQWNHGEVDDLTDKDRSEMNRLKAVQHANTKKTDKVKQVIKPGKARLRIDGRTYLEHTGAYTKREAQSKAEDIRKRGYYARVIKTGSGYTVYAAKKKEA